jgi:hypothetical protein
MSQYLSRSKITQGTTGFYQEKTRIPRRKLQEWRLKLIRNPDWRSYQSSPNKKLFTEEETGQVGETLEKDFIDIGRSFPPTIADVKGHQILQK